ncbi:hypothetical protein J4474_04725 [Candidatus Pacearchaeota archaeon]|nr:hypothetical protein [Candidatus Pacearchaeota archaeon]
MRFIKKRLKRIVFYALVLVVLIVLLFLIPANFMQSDISNLFTATTVVWAIIVGFFMAAALANYSTLQSLISSETAGLISLSYFVKFIDPLLSKKVNEEIDNYVIRAFDFELSDYIDKTRADFDNILKAAYETKNKNTGLFSEMVSSIRDLIKCRQEISLAGRKLMSLSSWVVISILTMINISLLYSIRSLEIISSVFTIVISLSMIIILFLLKDIDSNTFAEEKLAFDIYQEIFREIGKLPYYPEISIDKGRIQIPSGQKVRIGKYKNFPESLEKTIVLKQF